MKLELNFYVRMYGRLIMLTDMSGFEFLPGCYGAGVCTDREDLIIEVVKPKVVYALL